MSPVPVVDDAQPPSVVSAKNSLPKNKKRLIVCCDGTWQDGVVVKERWRYTNVMRLSRALRHQDERAENVIPQIVFYQSGIGSSPNFYSEYIQGRSLHILLLRLG